MLEEIYQKLSARFANEQICTLKALPPPFSLGNVKEASLLIGHAIAQKQKILIVGDYDADGILSVALMIRFFQSIGFLHFSFIIPHRFKDGYGISEALLQDYPDALVVTVDNGITALSVAEFCKARGQTLIITDHHTPKAVLPDALIINPKVSGFVQEEICGCLVAWYLCAGVKQSLGLSVDLGALLELVGIAIISDVMPLLEINRVLFKKALKILQSSPSPFAQILRQAYREIDAQCIAFYIAPLLNASGRMGEAEVALEFLLSQDVNQAMQHFEHLKTLNTQRKQIQSSLQELALEVALEGRDCVVAFGEDWHEGVLGILAGKLAQHFGKSAFVLSYKDGVYQGSGRSAGGVDLLKSVEQLPEGICEFGGHAKAIGIKISPAHIQNFHQLFKALHEEQYKQEEQVLASVQIEHINQDMLEVINSFAPYGEGNPQPFFHIQELEILECKIIKGAHTSFKIKSPHGSLGAIAFSYSIPEAQKLYDVIFSLQTNPFNQALSLHLQSFALCPSSLKNS